MCQSCAQCSCTHICQSETDNFCNACLLVLQVMCQSHALCSCTHKCQSQTDNFCSACLLVLQVTCQSHALCSCTHKCQSQTDNFCSACLLVLQSSQPILLFCCPPFTCLWFPTLRQPWKSPIRGDSPMEFQDYTSGSLPRYAIMVAVNIASSCPNVGLRM